MMKINAHTVAMCISMALSEIRIQANGNNLERSIQIIEAANRDL